MPYRWTTSPADTDTAELHLWPYNALKPEGFAAMVLGFFTFAMMPLFAVLGTRLFWGLLPFMVAATGALYYALRKNRLDRQVIEVLTLTPDLTRLTHNPTKGAVQSWEAQTYWVKLSLHPTGGPVPNYVTLKGGGREVELGAFLSEDERTALYAELSERIRLMAQSRSEG
ncbi:MAG: DUF2244 domain-containing protein [Pelagimonas sp.]|uniref:DUF2244 domain-containing protein n=1 Tax=Pelagimonas sp. TaxID=2073170 RepID=UPI003D6A0721